jgi:hypothetical protein
MMLRFPTHLFFATIVLSGLFSCSKLGCKDPDAANYNPEAKLKKGECIYTPGIKLMGEATLHVPVGGEFIDDGAIAIDADGSKPSVAVVNTVNTAKKGTYNIQYSAQLKSGEVTANRQVVVAFDRSNWVGTWKTNDDCGNIFFPDSMVTFVIGDQDGLIQTTDMFVYSPNAEIAAEVFEQQVTIPQQYMQVGNAWTTRFSAIGEMNDAGSAFKVKFSYKNLVSNSAFGVPGTCILKYTKVE